MPLPGRLLRRAPQRPADGLLRPRPDRPRRRTPRRRGPPRRRQFLRLGLDAGVGAASALVGEGAGPSPPCPRERESSLHRASGRADRAGSSACAGMSGLVDRSPLWWTDPDATLEPTPRLHPATPRWPATSARPMPSASASARSRASARTTPRRSSRRAAGATIPSATSGSAPACTRAAIERLADADAFRSLGLDRRDALWAARELGGGKADDRLPLFDVAGARRHPPRAGLRPAADAARRARGQRLPLSQPVAEGAPGLLPPPASRRARHRRQRDASRDARTADASPSPVSSSSASGRARRAASSS